MLGGTIRGTIRGTIWGIVLRMRHGGMHRCETVNRPESKWIQKLGVVMGRYLRFTDLTILIGGLLRGPCGG